MIYFLLLFIFWNLAEEPDDIVHNKLSPKPYNPEDFKGMHPVADTKLYSLLYSDHKATVKCLFDLSTATLSQLSLKTCKPSCFVVWVEQSLNDTYRIVRLRLSHKDQYVGADYREAEVEQDDGSLRANIPEEKRMMKQTWHYIYMNQL